MDVNQVSWHLRTYPLIVIFLSGFFGNAFIFFIFSRPSFCTSTITKYVRFLAIVDTITLLSGTIPSIYKGFTNESLEGKSNAGCIFQRFIMFASGDLSVWMLTIMTVDRLVAVVFPLQNALWKSKRNTIFILVIVLTLSVLKNFPIFFTLYRNNNTRDCDAKRDHIVYEEKIRPIISLILYYIIPTIIMTGCTIMIIKAMKSVIKNLRIMGTPGNRISISANDNNNNHYSKSLTRMSFAIYILYIVLITPSIIIWTVTPFINTRNIQIFFDVTNIFVFSHHALNFYLFIITGPRFRREVFIIFGKHYSTSNDSRDNSNKIGAPEKFKVEETHIG